MKYGTLFVVATPIGNLDDISARARQVLADADLVAAEDTRHTGRLLSHLGIKNRQIALHDHNEEVALERLIVHLKSGKSVALVSDAGTPLISDPGFRLLRAAHRHEIPVSPIPGPCAMTAALSVAGLATDRMCFEGFLPAKSTARKKRLAELARESRTVIVYEAVHRVAETVADLAEAYGGTRRAFIGRELSKLHEQCVNAELADLALMLADGRIPAKGEFVIIIEAGGETTDDVVEIRTDDLLACLADVLPGKQAVAVAATLSGKKRNDLYRRMLALTKEDDGSRQPN